MCGDTPEQANTNVPKPQSSGQSLNEFIENYPKLLEMQGQYGGVEAQQQLDLLQQYGLPTAEAMQSINQALYPNTAGLQEQLAGLASQGSEGGLPDFLQNKYRDEFSSALGTNVGSPIGADYQSSRMLQLGEDYNRYYQNLGMSLSGRQPLSFGQQPQITNQLSGYTPQGIAQTNAAGYAPYISGWSNAQNQNIAQNNWLYSNTGMGRIRDTFMPTVAQYGGGQGIGSTVSAFS